MKLSPKGVLTPTLALIFLGKLINTGLGQIFPTLEKIEKLIKKINVIIDQENTTLDILVSLRGGGYFRQN